MVTHSIRRPKTSSGLPIQNDSTIYTHNLFTQPPPPPPQQHHPQAHFGPSLPFSLARPKSTHDLCRPLPLAPSDSLEPKIHKHHRSSASLTLTLATHWPRDRAKEDEKRGSIRKEVDSVRSAAAAMVRKALQGSRDMRPVIPPPSLPSPVSSSTSSDLDSARASSAFSRARDAVREANRVANSTAAHSRTDRAMTRFNLRNSFRRGRDAASRPTRSGKTNSRAENVAAGQRAQPQPPPNMDDPSQFPQLYPPRGPGSAARASAAEHNKSQLRRQDTATSSTMYQYYEDQDEMMLDHDSAVEVCSLDGEPRKKHDPVTYLPHEITSLIMSYLDDTSLVHCKRVTKAWKDLASVNAVWRASFLGRYTRKPGNTLPFINMGGQGLGLESQKGQQWERMAKARRGIEANWAAKQPKAVYYTGHTDSVYCCQFDEDKIITGSRDRTVRVWELNPPYRCLKVLGGPAVRPALPTNDSALDTHPTATVHSPPTINGTPTGNALFHTPSDYHSASILCLQFDSEIMVTGSSDNTCIIWDIKTYEPIKRLHRHTAGVLDVCFDEKFIISCSKDTSICVWSRETGDLVKQLMGHKGPVNAVQLRNVGSKKLLVSASGDGLSKLWDLELLKEVKYFESKDRGLAAVEFSDDGRYVLAGGNDQVIYKYDVKTAECILLYKGHTNLVRSLFLDSANGRVLSGSYDQGIRVFDFETGEEMGCYENWTTSWILAAKSDYRRIVATSQDGRALMMDFGYTVPDAELLKGEPAKGLMSCTDEALMEVCTHTTSQ
ncbi:WD40 repeat-like protein [Tothia fuscella]|uniref:WD40 repeat-like protein n=1 Tax=Tothia fuscella TaxID=1048955 RepID=A0A9P4NXJ0_9PEZI|nr:WD40 repeat-like protein [Tothia fuscella]